MLRRQLRRLVAVIMVGVGLLTATSATTSAREPGPQPDRGTLVSVTPLERLDRAEVAAQLSRHGLDTAQIRYGVRSYRVEYRTVDLRGRLTTASQLAVLPESGQRRLTAAVNLHGTTIARTEVASMSDGQDRSTSYLLGAAGYAVSAPDYLGLGTGSGFHPYLHSDSTASAGLDGVRALGQLGHWHGQRLDREVMITGFSQGGHAAMALGRLLDGGADRQFRVGALAPVSGPYDTSSMVRDLVTTDLDHRASYLAYLIISWNRIHGLYDDPADAFRAPYAATIEELFDHTHPAYEVLSALPQDPADLFTPEFLGLLEHPTGRLAEVIKDEAEVCQWRPPVGVRLYSASGDRVAPAKNSLYCAAQVRQHGGRAQVVDLGEIDHLGSAARAMPLVVAQFDQARRH
ncbi:alpha/beta hydrolase family protein [Microlunatus sp. GCM10028923]|uniref:alpha/beta hydrolase family protein n=1 Tax=Microlunatus sp. GCM10028923 TaxID=3273400 RepID=UPI003623379C